MNITFRKAAAPALLALALLSSATWAQDTTTAAPVKKGGHAQKHEDFVEKRISDLHAQLKITNQQSMQWEAFADTMRDNAKKTDEALKDRSQKIATLNADEAMKSYAALAQLHADNMQKMVTAFTSLYNVLSDEQKQTADVVFRNQAEKKHHGHMHKGAAPAADTAAPAAK
ncbi:Spy/CpxP family protein refolding chaperone [Nevskia soli]|uniref:Spy/CpxP family protein refolding chaperone n=1 Tax=Nevskia soli TaxID=418856 RepID=UPI0004A6DDAB|nr:Spy/CpxP family protein refolding chaperone [Nevskia soli]